MADMVEAEVGRVAISRAEKSVGAGFLARSRRWFASMYTLVDDFHSAMEAFTDTMKDSQ